MSLSTLLTPNPLDLFCHSITADVSPPFISPNPLIIGTATTNPTIILGDGPTPPKIGLASTPATGFTDSLTGDLYISDGSTNNILLGVGTGHSNLGISNTAITLYEQLTLNAPNPNVNRINFNSTTGPVIAQAKAPAQFFSNVATGDFILTTQNAGNVLQLGVVPNAVANISLINGQTNINNQLLIGAGRVFFVSTAGPALSIVTGSGQFFPNTLAGDFVITTENALARIQIGVNPVVPSAMTIVNGAVNFNVPITLPTVGGTPSSFGYYEDFTQISNIVGAFGTPQPCSLRYIRIGNQTTMILVAQVTGAAATPVAGTALVVDTVPPRFLPANSIDMNIAIIQNPQPVFSVGTVSVTTGFGVIQISSGPDPAAIFGVTGINSVLSFTITYGN